MGHNVCCVPNCKNNGKNFKGNFYRFPKNIYKKDQRQKWIAAVNKKNVDGTPWVPNDHHIICSVHFIGSKKSDIPSHPSYSPTLFLRDLQKHYEVAANQKLQRHDRFMARRKADSGTLPVTTERSKPEVSNSLSLGPLDSPEQILVEPDFAVRVIEDVSPQTEALINCAPLHADKGCQADLYFNVSAVASNTSVIIKYVKSDSSTCDAEIQTDINVTIAPKVTNKRNVKCGTSQVKKCDKKVGPDVERVKLETDCHERCFKGFTSIKKNENMLELPGVSQNNFQFLLDSFENSEKWRVKKEDRLLIFLTKLKTGMTFRAIGVLFCLHRTTISEIFFSLLTTLCEATAGLVPWINRDVVQSTMPECFREEFPDTRVVIDCTEFRIEIPAAIDERVYSYSHYKHGFTLKGLIGMTPCGLISFKSRLAGGRKSDSQITIESGLIELLEDGDEVLADKGFPAVEEKIDELGRRSLIVMPPFLEGNKEFTKEEAELTYKVAKVRIHVERIMQRLRTYRVLDKIPEHLFERVDDVLHMCCVLVNLQPPIISQNDSENPAVEKY